MLQCVRTTLVAAVFAVLMIPAAGAQAMNEAIKKPTAIPLDFFEWIERDGNWLRTQLAGRGLDGKYFIAQDRLETEDAEVLYTVNRIRAFAHLAAPGITPPYFDLMLREAEDAMTRCVTLFPKSIVPDIGPMDFDMESFAAEEAEPTILDMCRVEAAAKAEFDEMGRETLRGRFFESNGDLKTEFVDLNNDPAFLAAVIDHGFFAYQGDVTGRIRVDP